jgi:hypothetical protein
MSENPDTTVPLLKPQYLTEGYDPKLIEREHPSSPTSTPQTSKTTIGGVSEQIILYAKGWFDKDFPKQCNNLDKLREIIATTCALDKKYVFDKDIIGLIINAYSKCIKHFSYYSLSEDLTEICGQKWWGAMEYFNMHSTW